MKASEFTLTESFDSQINGKLIRATSDLFTTEALIGNRKIVFNASGYVEDDRQIWEIEFTERSQGNMTYGKSGSGNEMQVFSFVIDSIKELIARYHPNEIQFGADKGDGNRSGLYKKLATRIKMPGYSLGDIMSGAHTDIFRIVKNTGLDK